MVGFAKAIGVHPLRTIKERAFIGVLSFLIAFSYTPLKDK